MKNKLFSKIVSFAVAFSVICGSAAPAAAEPVVAKAADSVYNFYYGSGITWGVEDELPTFAPITATQSNPMDSFVANDSMDKSNSTDRLNTDHAVRYAMVTLQGIVNRTRPQIIVQENREEGQDVWPNELVGEGKYKKTTDYIYMINKYKSYIKGMVVYNSNIGATKNVATSIAGVEDCIAVDSGLADELKKKCGLEVKIDLNKESSIKDDLSAYNYLYDNYYKNGKLNHRLLVGLNPDAHVPYNRDIAVATKSAVFWLEPDNNEQRAVLDKFFDLATPGVTYNLGWWPSEDSGICYATKKGVASIPSDWFENMTVYMAGEKKFDIPEVPAKPKLENKIYVAFAVSDGDNTAYNEHVMRIRWGEEKRQTYPISWTVSPALYYCAPQMLNYYHQTAGKDMLISGPSGMGYTKATRWRTIPEFFQKNMAATDEIFEKTGLNVVTIWDRISEDCYEEYTSNMNSLLGVAINNNGFNDADKNNSDSMYNGEFLYYPAWGEIKYKNDTPILGLGWPFGYASGKECSEHMYNALADMAKNYNGSKPEFRMAQFVAWDANVAQITEVADKLNQNYPGKFEFVRADHMYMLANEYNNVPYNLALQQKAVSSNESSDASNANDGTISTGWEDANSDDKWYQVDLGTQSRITRYVLKNARTGYYAASQNTKSYSFEYSMDGMHWRTAETITDNSEDIIYSELRNAITARYVRIKFLDAGFDGVARIQDLEVYGNPVYVTQDELRDLVSFAEVMISADMLCKNNMWNQFESALNNAHNTLNQNYNNNKDNYRNAYNTLADAMKELSHKEVVTDAVEATCDKPGQTSGSYCSVCNSVIVRPTEVAKKEHTYVTIEGREATCTQTGLSEGKSCSVCKKVLKVQEIILATGHRYGEWKVTESASCGKDGIRERICSNCNQKEIQPIIAIGHTWDDGVITKPATEKTDGIKTYTCTSCKDTWLEVIPATGNGTNPPADPPAKTPDLEVGAVVNETGAAYKVSAADKVVYVKPLDKKTTSVTIPATVILQGKMYKVTSIDANAFSGCSKLKKVTIGKNITSISSKAFYKCTALTKIVIPESVQKIGKQAFYGCKKLKNITIKTKKLTKSCVGSKAFNGTPKKAKVKVPKSKLKSYKKLLVSKGIHKKAKIKK